MSFQNLVELSYWFAVTTPPFQTASFIGALIVLGAFFISGIVLKVLANKNKENPPLARGLTRLARPLFFLALLGFLLIWFRQLGAAVLSARFWMALIFGITVVWFAFVLRGILKTYKDEYGQIEQRRKYEAYLPRRK